MFIISRLTFFVFVFAFTSPVLSKEKIKSPLNKTWSLNHFMINDEPIMLENVNGSYAVSFPISDRVHPESVELNLLINNSNLLHDRRAQIALFINNYVVGQVKLNPANSEISAKFTIAKEYLQPGYNWLSFRAAQHYADSQCEDWNAPELWTSINSVKSTLTLNYYPKPVDERLSDLNKLINDRLDEYSVSILRVGDTLSDDDIYAGAMLAQGIKLRLKYVPLKLDSLSVKPYQWPELDGGKIGRFSIDPARLKHDAILLGTKDQLKKLIPDQINKAIQGPYLGIFRQDHNPNQFILIVSGTDSQQLKMASQAFVLLNMPFPDGPQTVVKGLDLADSSVTNRKTMVPGNTYRFSQMGFKDKSFEGTDSGAELEFRLPADMYNTEEAMVTVNLDLAYGAAMRKDSVINIRLNGLFNHAVHLVEQSGARYHNYQIKIPLRNFQPGLNRLSFNAVMTPSEYGECTFVQRQNLIATLFQDSTITFPESGNVVTLPDLNLLKRTGFPLVKNGTAEHTAVRLLDQSSDSLVAAWHFIAKLASINEAPLFDILITQSETKDRPNVVMIGKPTKATWGMFDTAPVRLGELNHFPYRYRERQLAPKESLPEWLHRVLLNEYAKPAAVNVVPENVEMLHTAGLGRKFLLMSYPSPKADGGVVFALLSEPERSLYAGLTELLSPELWNRMQGNVFIWDKQRNFDWLQEGDTFVTADNNVRLSLIMHFSRHPWQWLALILTTLVLTAWLIHKLLTGYKQKTHQGVNEDAH